MVAVAQLFMLFRESTPIHFYTKSNEDLIWKEEDINRLFRDLDIALGSVQIENYQGFYDVDNINTFLSNYNILNDYYPVSPRRKLRESLKGWTNWKLKRESGSLEKYKIEQTPTEDNSFGEIHTRKIKEPNNKYLIVSHDAICFQNQAVDVEKLSDASIEQIECVELKKELKKWFNCNRIPARIYHASSKHGENRKGAQHGESELYCSHKAAEEMLAKAIGIVGKDELFYYDKNHKTYIIFRYEGKNPQNQFHAYHLHAKDQISKYLSEDIKKILANCV
jgi:hypothetical protein